MDSIRFRDMQRWSASDLEQALPVCVSHDSQAKFVILTLSQYNQLVRKALSSHDSQATAAATTPLYNPSIHTTGDKVVVRQGKSLVDATVPELDGDGRVVPDYY